MALPSSELLQKYLDTDAPRPGVGLFCSSGRNWLYRAVGDCEVRAVATSMSTALNGPINRSGLGAFIRPESGPVNLGLETQALIIWFSIASFLWIFFSLGNEIGEGDTGAFDRHLIGLLRTSGKGGGPIAPAWFKDSMRDITALGGFTFLTLLTFVVVLSLLFHRKRREGLIVAITAISAQTSTELFKILYDRPRPDPIPTSLHAYTASFQVVTPPNQPRYF